MQLRRFIYNFALLAVAFSTCGSALFANNNNNNNNGGANNNNNNNTNVFGNVAGVEIDPLGVLRVLPSDPRVTWQRLQSARQELPQNLRRPSSLRKVSLNRLESQLAAKLAKGERVPADMLSLAGLTRLQYVFFYPESGDIVIAGPAEGFGQDSNGRFVGVDSGKPTLLLEDLVIALRAFPPVVSNDPNHDGNMIKVSIDPTQEGLKRMKQTLGQIGGTFQPDQVPNIVNALRQSLGLNEVSLEGVPRTSHFAHVLVEADYRMKLIGIGLENPPVPMTTYIAKLAQSNAGANDLLRWFFVPNYDVMACSEDGTAMMIEGQGLKLVAEDELVNRNGERKVKGATTNPASKAFTNDFTKKFNLIADASPVYGQLRNLVDLTFAAAFIQDRDLYQKSGWNLGVLASEDTFAVETRPAPRQVETAINAIMRGSRLVTPIGGGIQIQAKMALKNVQGDEDNSLAKAHDALNLDAVPAAQWWWD